MANDVLLSDILDLLLSVVIDVGYCGVLPQMLFLLVSVVEWWKMGGCDCGE